MGERLRGVQSCTVSWSAPETYVNAVGYEGGFAGTTIEDYLTSSFEVERLLISEYDPMVDFLESEVISGEIRSGNNNFAFNRGHITSYSCSCAVGSVPTLNFSIDAYGEAGGSAPKLGRSKEKNDKIRAALPGSVTLDVAGHSSNSIQSFDILITVGRNTIDQIGSLSPLGYIIQYPIEVDCQFVMLVQDYDSSNLFDFICNPTIQDLNIKFDSCDSDNSDLSKIRKFFIPSAKLVDFDQEAGIGDSMIATFTYKSLITNIQLLKKIVTGVAF